MWKGPNYQPLTPPAASIDSANSMGSPHVLSITEHCYGLILLHHRLGTPATKDNTSILLVHQKRPPPSPPYWGFPKGHPESQDADHWATALRELHEETGLNPLSVTPIKSFKSVEDTTTPPDPTKPCTVKFISRYPSRKGGIKEVTYFLGCVAELDELAEQAEEVLECRWANFLTALHMVKEEPVQEVLECVSRWIS